MEKEFSLHDRVRNLASGLVDVGPGAEGEVIDIVQPGIGPLGVQFDDMPQGEPLYMWSTELELVSPKDQS